MRNPVALSGTALALLLTAPGLTGTASAACNGVPGIPGAPLAQTDFTSPGNACYVVPAGVESIRATVVGGQGGAGYDPFQGGGPGGGARGGFGAVVQARLDVVAGQEIALSVGQNGFDGIFDQGARGGAASRLDQQIIAGGGGGGGGLPDGMFTPAAAGGIGGSAGPGGGSGDDSTGGGGGGRPGTFNAGGAGGISASLQFQYVGEAGGPSFGGNPRFFLQPEFGAGGGGGDGAFGGGAGGSASEFDTPYAAGGGGGAGSTFIDPSVDGPSVSTDGTGTPLVSITAGGVAALTALPASALTFSATQPQGTLSAPQTVVLTSTGTAALRIDAVTIAGANPDDYVISGDTCRRPLPATSTCAVSVRFVPQATGPRTAQLEIDGNVVTTTFALSGTGDALPKGDTGDTGLPGPIGTGTSGSPGLNGAPGVNGLDGATGSAGPIGATGPRGTDGSNGPKGADGTNGRNGADASTTCLITTSRTVAGATPTSSVLCTIETVAARKSGSRARLSRRGKIVATGVERKGQPLSLKLRKGVKLTAGTYRLTRTYRQAGRTVTENRTVRVKKATAAKR